MAPGSPPDVTVVTPAFNAQRFIAATMASVMSQTLSSWEMLVVDDASTDATARIVEEYSQRDPRIRLIALPDNQGQGPARNVALAAARAPYVAFLDADDLWDPEKLERQVAFMRTGSHAFSYTAYRVISEDGSLLGTLRHFPPSMGYREMLCEQPGCLTVMLDRRALGPLRFPDYRRNQDGALWLALLRDGRVRAQGMAEVLASYRAVRGSVTAGKLKSAGAVWKVLREQEKLDLARATYYFGQYAVRGLRKHIATRARQ